MKLRKLMFFVLGLTLFQQAMAQVNMQVFYDMGTDRKYVTMTLEMFKADKWGNTYFFIDHDFNYKQHDGGEKNKLAPGGTYLEIARCLNFWQKTKLAPLSLHVEYNGGITKSYPINSAWLAGVDYFLHDQSYNNTLNLKLLYKKIIQADSKVPMQFTGVWTCKDLFGLKGLTFDGFADVWFEDHSCNIGVNEDGTKVTKTKHTVFITEPQLWYNVGRHFGCNNLNVGTEIELSNNFGTTLGFKCRPCLGVKWNF